MSMSTAKMLLTMAKNELRDYPLLQEKVNAIILEMSSQDTNDTKSEITSSSTEHIDSLRDILAQTQYKQTKTDYGHRQMWKLSLMKGSMTVRRSHRNNTYVALESDMLSGLHQLSLKEPSILDIKVKVVDYE